jgi:hypothetical protein
VFGFRSFPVGWLLPRLAVCLTALFGVACGRSSLDEGYGFGVPGGDDGGLPPNEGGPPPDSGPPPPPQGCNAMTCAQGCCDGSGHCQSGITASACGTGGARCTSCTGNSTCDSQARICKIPPPFCSSSNCRGCCSSGNQCLMGTAAGACGSGGSSCQNCAVLGAQCGVVGSSNGCVKPPPACDSSNCQGCCDSSGQCQPGFLDGDCGQGGAACLDCGSTASTCDVNATPRTCTNQQNQCPASYGGCPGGLQTQPQTPSQNVCTGTDLQNAASACSASAHSTGCASFFAFETAQHPSCAACLAPFDFDFTELKGIFSCVAAFSSTSCNGESACIADCANATCSRCPDVPTALQCETQQLSSSCSSYVQSWLGARCFVTAESSGAFFCAPNGGDFGAWLQGVGTYYCGP